MDKDPSLSEWKRIRYCWMFMMCFGWAYAGVFSVMMIAGAGVQSYPWALSIGLLAMVAAEALRLIDKKVSELAAQVGSR